MRAVVTGTAGFIDSHLVDALPDRRDELAVLDHLRRTPRPWLAEALGRGAVESKTFPLHDARDGAAARGLLPASQRGLGARPLARALRFGPDGLALHNAPKVVGWLRRRSTERAAAVNSRVCDQLVPLSTSEVAEVAKLLENIAAR